MTCAYCPGLSHGLYLQRGRPNRRQGCSLSLKSLGPMRPDEVSDQKVLLARRCGGLGLDAAPREVHEPCWAAPPQSQSDTCQVPGLCCRTSSDLFLLGRRRGSGPGCGVVLPAQGFQEYGVSWRTSLCNLTG